MRRLILIVAMTVVCGMGLEAQKPSGGDTRPPAAAEPSLSDAQKLEWQKMLTRLASEQARAAQAEAEYLKAVRSIETVQKDAQALLAAFSVPGYALDPQTLTYTKTDTPSSPTKK